jgi:hypothetical protein
LGAERNENSREAHPPTLRKGCGAIGLVEQVYDNFEVRNLLA